MVGFRDITEYSIDYALSKNIDMVISRYHTLRKKVINILNGKIINESYYMDSGIGIRIYNEGINVYASINIPSLEYVKREIDRAYKLTKNLDKKYVRSITPVESESRDVSYILKEDKPFDDYYHDLIDFLISLDKNLVNFKELSVKTRFFKITYTVDRRYIVSSEGVKILSEIPRILIAYTLLGKGAGSYVTRKGMFGASGGIATLNYEDMENEIKTDVKAMYKILFSAVSPPIGDLNVVVGNEAAGVIAHEVIGHAFEADGITGVEGAQDGKSYLDISDLGESIASHETTVIDDPTTSSAYGFYLYDDEGIQTRKRVLIKNGIVEEFLHSRTTGYLTGVNSNGSARSESYKDEPLVRMGTTFFEPGDYKLEELIHEARYGLYIRNFSGWNIDDTRVSQRYVGFEAYLIDGGDLKEPVKYPILESNTYDLLRSLIARGEDFVLYPALCAKGDPMQIVPVSIGGPHLLFERVSVRRR